MQRTTTILSVLLFIALFFLSSFLLHRSKRTESLTLYGNVDIREVDMGFRVYGRVASMPFEEGDFVEKGSFVAAIDKQPYLDRVEEAKAKEASAQYELMNAEEVLKRRQEILGQGAVSEEEYSNAVSARNIAYARLKEAQAALGVAMTNLRDTEIFAPIDGIILTRIREPGTVVNVAEPVYTLSVTSPVWVRAYVTEPELGLIHPGMPAEIITDTPGGKIYKGHIGFISPVAEFTPKTVQTTDLRTDLVYRLRIIVDTADQGLRQGMPVTVHLPLHSSTAQSGGDTK